MKNIIDIFEERKTKYVFKGNINTKQIPVYKKPGNEITRYYAFIDSPDIIEKLIQEVNVDTLHLNEIKKRLTENSNMRCIIRPSSETMFAGPVLSEKDINDRIKYKMMEEVAKIDIKDINYNYWEEHGWIV